MKDDRRKQIEALVARREAVTMEELREEPFLPLSCRR